MQGEVSSVQCSAILDCAKFSVHWVCAECSVELAVFIVQGVLCRRRCVVYSETVQSVVYSLQCSVYSVTVQSALFNVTLYSVVCSSMCALVCVHCAVCSV